LGTAVSLLIIAIVSKLGRLLEGRFEEDESLWTVLWYIGKGKEIAAR